MSFLLYFLPFVGRRDLKEMKAIRCGELSMEASAVGIDVRSIMELKANPAPKALHIPISELSRVTESLEDKDTTIYVFCESGMRAAMAKKLLKAKGYKNTKNISDWRTWNQLQNN